MPNRVTCWYGTATGSWWALARDRAGRWRLIEAVSQADLGRRLAELGVRGGAAPLRPAVPSRPAYPAVAPTVAAPAEPGRHRHPAGHGGRRTLGGLIAPGG